MSERLKTAGIACLVIAGILAFGWRDSEVQLRWERNSRPSFEAVADPYEVVSRWNEVSFNPFTWSKPFTRKLVLVRASEIQVFDAEGLIVVPVTRLIDTEALRVPKEDAIARFMYWYDLKKRFVARVETDMFWVPTSEKTYEPIPKGSDLEFVYEWAMKKLAQPVSRANER